MEINNSIYFDNNDEKYEYMNNCSKYNFKDNCNVEFNCIVQYFVYIKCLTFDSDNQILLTKILNENNPIKIKKYGRLVKNYFHDLWKSRRYIVMLDGLTYQFTQNDFLYKQLLETKNKNLYKTSRFDNIWGIGFSVSEAIKINKNKYGQNLLGQALMEIRTRGL